MPPRRGRPAPLCEEAVAIKQHGPSNVLYGATNEGMPLPVKNGFIDVPSGLTPTSMRGATSLASTLVTAPPILDKSAGFSFMQQAMLQSPAPSPSSAQRVVYSGLPYSGLPLVTPSPNAATAQIRMLHAAFSPAYDYQSCAFASGGYAPRPSVTVLPQTLEQQLEEDDDEDDDDDDIVAPHLRNIADAPQPPPGALHPSLGSELHDQQQCKRCCFFPRGRCTNGYNCEFCHYEHERRKRKSRKKKKKSGTETMVGTAVSSEALVYSGMPYTHAASSGQTILQLPAAPPPPPPAAVQHHTHTYPPHMIHHAAAAAPTYVSSYVAAPPPPFPPMGPPTHSPTITTQYQYAAAPSQPPPTAVFAAPPPPMMQSVGHLHVPPPPLHQPGFAVQQVHVSPQPVPMPPSTTAVVKPQAQSPSQVQFSPPRVDAPSLPTTDVMAPPLQSPKFSLSPGTQGGLSPPPMQSPKFGSVAGGQMMPPPMLSPKFPGSVAQALAAAASSPGTYIVSPKR